MLALITPTRRRWNWLVRQAEIVAAQLDSDDRWIIVRDNDRPVAGFASPDYSWSRSWLRKKSGRGRELRQNSCEFRYSTVREFLPGPRIIRARIREHDVCDEIETLIGRGRLVWVDLNYARPVPPVACVNAARNAGAALAPAGCDLVEVDDHDLLEPLALAQIRHAFASGCDYVFGDFHQQAIVESPDGRSVLETWPDVKHDYRPGGFTRGEIEAIGVRAIRRELWDRLGGWSNKVWPCADYDFATRAEAVGANIICLDQPLCTVTVEAESLSGEYRGESQGGR